MVHTRSAYQVWDVLSDLGGMYEIFFFVFGLIVFKLNDAQLINLMLSKRHGVKYSFKERCFGFGDKYKKGKNRVQKDLDVINIMTTIDKLKAGMASIIKNDQIDACKEIYYEDNKVYSSSTDNKFLKFLNDCEY